MSKSPEAFRTISEVAEWLGVQAHVLRFWESKFSQVKPVKRAGGRRYYRPADMLLLGGIKNLLHDDGQSIKDVQALLREQGVAHVAEHSQPLDGGETVVEFPAPPAAPAAQMDMDLPPPLEPAADGPGPQPDPVWDPAAPAAEADSGQFGTPAPEAPGADTTPLAADTLPPEAPPAQDEPLAVPDAAQEAPQPAEASPVHTDPGPAPDAAAPLQDSPAPRPRIIEAPDTDEAALASAAPGVLSRLANLAALPAAAQAEAADCAAQLRALAARH
ncbi:MerR family transcriptional regulator [Roseobacteraceae bacterium NS-SX3]